MITVAATPAPAAAPPRAAASTGSFGEVLSRRTFAGAPPPAPRALPAAALDALRGVEAARAQLDRAIAQARAGRSFSAGELLALQLDAYRLSQTVEVASRVAEAGAQSVKQAVNTQV
jgi:hypothetical protein